MSCSRGVLSSPQLRPLKRTFFDGWHDDCSYDWKQSDFPNASPLFYLAF
jgi:hypothetical protein